jgi:hyperosmotically inducible periplasmic protein
MFMKLLKPLKPLLLMMLFLALLCGIWSCRTPSGRTAGRVVDDAGITTVVKTKIFQDPYLSGFSVSVDTYEGQVTLTGSVNSELSKQRAGELAQSVDGVVAVHNHLVVR